MLHLFLDDSVSRDGKVTMVGGYIAHHDMWPDLVMHWTATLVDAGVEHFHATDFFNGRKEFAGWDLRSHRHVDFAKRFTGIAQGSVTLGVAMGVDTAAFAELVSSSKVLSVNTPQGRLTPLMWCAAMCLRWISTDAPGRPADEPISVTMASGKGSGQALEYCRWLKKQRAPWMACFQSFATERAAQSVQLQAADLLVHEATRHVANEMHSPQRGVIRQSFGRLLRDGLLQVSYHSRADLENLVPRLEHAILAGDPKFAADLYGVRVVRPSTEGPKTDAEG